MDNQFSIKQCIKFAKKLRIPDHSVVMVKEGTTLGTKEGIEALVNAARGIGLQDVLFVVSSNLDDLKVVDEQEMNESGWFRIDHLKKLVHAEDSK